MARAVATKYPDSLAEPSFAAKIRDARYLVRNNHFVVTFDSGKEYSFPRSALDIDDGSELASVRVDRKRFFFHVTQTSGNRYEVPWDRVLHEAEPSYPFFRGRATRAKKSPGNRHDDSKNARRKRGHTGSTGARRRNDSRKPFPHRSLKASPYA